MGHKNIDEDHGEKGKSKPRGRPFVKGENPRNKRKSNTTLLDDSGNEISSKGGDIAPEVKQEIVEPTIEEIKQFHEDFMNSAQIENNLGYLEGDEIMERIDFMNGKNKLSLLLVKKHNRMFRFRVFMNDETELRAATYTGATTGYSFWKLLIGALKK